MGKNGGTKNNSLLFIETKTSETNEFKLPNAGYLEKMEQVKIDELAINKIILVSRTVDLNGKKGIDWNDPKQILILSPDGKDTTQLTDNKLYVQSWTVNKKTGTIVITGYYDSNNNGKYDKTDQTEIGIYDLKTLKCITKI